MRLLLLILALLILTLVIRAQDIALPAVLLTGGELVSWSPNDPDTFTTLTFTNQRIQEAAMSPDGQWIAYIVTAEVTIDAIERTGGFSGLQPTDVGLLNLDTLEHRTIAAQPENARLQEASGHDIVIVRSNLSWSPDSTQLVWGDIVTPRSIMRLGMYHVVNDVTTTVVPPLPPQFGFPLPFAPHWGDGGIVVRSFIRNSDGDGELHDLYFLEPDMTVRHIVRFDGDTIIFSAEDFIREWLIFDDTPYYFIGNGQTNLLINASTGHISTPSELPYYEASAGINNDIRVLLEYDVDTDMFVSFIEDSPFVLTQTHSDSFAFLPNNDLVVHEGQGQLGAVDYLTRDLIETQHKARSIHYLPPTVNITELGAVGGAELILATPPSIESCEGLLASRLQPGDTGRVVFGLGANNVRERPRADSELVTALAPGTPFSVLAGPACADGFPWWFIDTGNLIGWTAEGGGDTYWIEPIN